MLQLPRQRDLNTIFTYLNLHNKIKDIVISNGDKAMEKSPHLQNSHIKFQNKSQELIPIMTIPRHCGKARKSDWNYVHHLSLVVVLLLVVTHSAIQWLQESQMGLKLLSIYFPYQTDPLLIPYGKRMVKLERVLCDNIFK